MILKIEKQMRPFFKQIAFLLFMFLTCTLAGQNAEASFKLLKSEIQKGKAGTFSYNSWKELSAIINETRLDSTSQKKFDYLIPVYEAGINSQNTSVRQFTVEILIKSLGKNAVLTRKATERLQNFRRADFTEATRLNLKMVFSTVSNNNGNLAKLLAFACGRDCIETLENEMSAKNLNKQDQKDFRLALIRAGDDRLEPKLLKSVKEQVVNDRFVYTLTNDLTYTRSKVIFDYLLELIMSDEKKCTSANNDNPEAMICAYRLIEKVAPYINGFPAKVNAYNELETKDYPKLLSEVRDWIGKNKSNYQLNTEVY